MDEIRHLQSLDRAASQEPLPRIDVAGPVLNTIARQTSRGPSVFARFARPGRPSASQAAYDRTLFVFAVAAAVVAAATLGLAWQALSSCLDPLHGLLGAFSMVMQ